MNRYLLSWQKDKYHVLGSYPCNHNLCKGVRKRNVDLEASWPFRGIKVCDACKLELPEAKAGL